MRNDILRMVKCDIIAAGIGSTVNLTMNGVERTFTIVGVAESNVSEGKISNECSVGAAILGHKKGDTVETVGPTGRQITLIINSVEN